MEIQILTAIIIMLTLICRFIYNLNFRDTVINSFIYSLVYILLEASIYWIISTIFEFRVCIICFLDLIISSTIILICVIFYNRLNKFYNKK